VERGGAPLVAGLLDDAVLRFLSVGAVVGHGVAKIHVELLGIEVGLRVCCESFAQVLGENTFVRDGGRGCRWR
jgi:hypothetical protein